jgi:hypothetical protein
LCFRSVGVYRYTVTEVVGVFVRFRAPLRSFLLALILQALSSWLWLLALPALGSWLFGSLSSWLLALGSWLLALGSS